MTPLSFSLHNPSEFSKFLKYFLAFEPTCRLICTENGIQIQCMDGGHTAITEIKLPPEYFVEYSCEGTLDIGIHIETVYSITKNATKALKLTSNGTTLDIMINEDSFEANYQVRTIDIDTDVMNIPDMDANYLVDIPLDTIKKWKKYIHDCKKANTTFTPGDVLVISSENDNGLASLTEKITGEYDDANSLQISAGNMERFYAGILFGKPYTIKMVNGAPLESNIVFDNAILRSLFAPMFTDEELEPPAKKPRI